MFKFKKKIDKKYIVLIGPQSSGKGSYSGALQEKYKIIHIATGDLLRKNIEEKTRLGIAAQKYVEKGELVPDHLVLKLIKRRLAAADAKNGALFDGFPRTIAQAKSLVKGVGVSAVVYVTISDELVIKRCLNRRICNKCGKITKIEVLKKDEKCACGGNFITRDDDNRPTVEKRLKAFYNYTMPVVDYFKQIKNAAGRNVFIEVDASGEILAINADIISKLEQLFKTSASKDLQKNKEGN